MGRRYFKQLFDKTQLLGMLSLTLTRVPPFNYLILKLVNHNLVVILTEFEQTI